MDNRKILFKDLKKYLRTIRLNSNLRKTEKVLDTSPAERISLRCKNLYLMSGLNKSVVLLSVLKQNKAPRLLLSIIRNIRRQLSR